jgi:hypothetical protein
VAEATLVLDPVGSLERQADRARSMKADTVVAVDALFWPWCAPAFDVAERAERLDAALAALDGIDARLLVVGDIPALADAARRALPVDGMAGNELRDEANGRIRAWAAERPHVVVVPLERWWSQLSAGRSERTPARLDGTNVVVEPETSIFGRDGLHPTVDGALVLASATLDVMDAHAGSGSPGRFGRVATLDGARAALEELKDDGGLNSDALLREDLARRDAALRERTAAFDAFRELESGRATAEDVAALVARRFEPGESRFRDAGDLLTTASWIQMRPDLRPPLETRYEALRAVVLAGAADADGLLAIVDFATILGRESEAIEAVEALMPKVEATVEAARRRSQGRDDRSPSAYLVDVPLRRYQWFVGVWPRVAVAFAPDADAFAGAIERNRDELARNVAFGERAGFIERGGMPVAPASEELERFAVALERSDRTDDAAAVRRRAAAQASASDEGDR